MTNVDPEMRHYPTAIEIRPVSAPVDFDPVIPGSKSLTNRALICAALAEGESQLDGALFSDDTRYMASALNTLGIPVETEPSRLLVEGQAGRIPATTADLFVGNAGTAMRFLTAVLPLGSGDYRIDGIPRMRQRPIGPLIDALNYLGAHVESELEAGYPPLSVDANGLRGGSVTMAGNRSSQFFSALLLASPGMTDGLELLVEGDLVSKPYMTMTAQVMRDFGVDAELNEQTWSRFQVESGQQYEGRSYQVEPDASNASYFFAAAAVTGGRVRVEGLGTSSTQGDLQFVHALKKMGATVTIADDFTEVTGPPGGTLSGVDLDFNPISDTAQTLAAIAPFASGPTTIRGVAHARLKETDRVSALATELTRLGQEVTEFPDGLTIEPRPLKHADIQTYDDHRMAMSFAVTSLRAPGVRILDPACVAKTFPNFFEVFTAGSGADVVAHQH